MPEHTNTDTQRTSNEKILSALNSKYDGTLPKEALRAAQACSEEITPGLIEFIRQVTQKEQAGNHSHNNGHLFALYLLTEFQAKEALPVILESISLPDEGPFNLYGDVITEDLPRILAALAVDTPECVSELITNPAVNRYVRWSAAGTFLYWVRDGGMARQEAVLILRDHLTKAIRQRDEDLVTGLVTELSDYASVEASDEIKDAFEQRLVDTSVIDLEFVEKSLDQGAAWFEKTLSHCRETGITDTVAEFSNWASFREKKSSQPARVSPQGQQTGELWDAGSIPYSVSIQRSEPKVGRNEPCPCGSGKKYKKCCGRG